MNARTKERLELILMFAKRIKKDLDAVSLANFLENVEKQDAVLYRLGQIGETATKIPDDEQEKYPAIFWHQMIALRHRLFHDYGEISLVKIYEITQKPIAQLVQVLETALDCNANDTLENFQAHPRGKGRNDDWPTKHENPT